MFLENLISPDWEQSVGSCRTPVSNHKLEKDDVEDVLEVQNLIKDLVHFLSL